VKGWKLQQNKTKCTASLQLSYSYLPQTGPFTIVDYSTTFTFWLPSPTTQLPAGTANTAYG
jgi:hypothetical protein